MEAVSDPVMKSWWIRSESAGTALELREGAVPQPGAGEILVRVRAASLNRGELLAAIELHAAGAPRPAGTDLAGEVVRIGEGVSGIEPGARVMGRGRGAFARYAVLSAHQAIAIPERLGFEQAAAVPVAYITAYEVLGPLGRLRAGETLLVAGISSGVGVACLQLAKMIGARVIGTSGSAAKLERLKALGLDAGVVARGSGFAAAVLEATAGRGADLAANLVGGSAFPECLRALANQGRLAIVGYVDRILEARIDLEAVHGKRLQIFGVSNARLTPAERAAAVRGFAREIVPALADGRIVPVLDRVFAFEELPAAKAYVEAGAHLGKVVLRVD